MKMALDALKNATCKTLKIKMCNVAHECTGATQHLIKIATLFQVSSCEKCITIARKTS